MPEECPCNGKPLSLSLREAASSFHDLTVYAVRKLFNKAPRACSLQRIYYLFIGSIFLNISHVLCYSSREHCITLWHIGDQLPYGCTQIHGLSAFSLYHCLTLLRSDECKEQSQHRCLTFTGRSDQCNYFMRIRINRGPVKNLITVAVGILYVTDFYTDSGFSVFIIKFPYNALILKIFLLMHTSRMPGTLNRS